MIMKYFNKLPKLRVAGSNPVCRSKENSDSQVVGYQNSLFSTI